MMTNSIAGQKWWKIGAAAFLSVGLLGACGDGEDEDNMDDDVEEEIKKKKTLNKTSKKPPIWRFFYGLKVIWFGFFIKNITYT